MRKAKLQHTDPQKPRVKFDKKKQKTYDYWAHAPYNFVPLPERVITVDPPLPFDSFDGESGWIVCEIETCSPTYTRGLMTHEQYLYFGNKKAEELTEDEKRERSEFYATIPEDLVDGLPKPRLPGSSLRGMIRALVEIITHSKVRWVSNAPYVSFRAVAATRADPDPLLDPYEKILGKYGRDVSSGYLARQGDKWYVEPARLPKDLGFRKEGAFIKIKQKRYLPQLKAIPGFKEFDDREYRPAFFPVSFSVVQGRNQEEKPFTAVGIIGPRDARLGHVGVLVCSGNMLETGSRETESPRGKFAVVLERDSKQRKLEIPQDVLDDYRRTLTDFQSSPPFDPIDGCLKDGAPVFYVVQNHKVVAFGHTPYFRVAARRPGVDRASTPRDFVPQDLSDDDQLDMADVLFGWTAEDDGKRTSSMAGRVFFEDAKLVSHKEGVWYSADPIMPKVLATPKPTTFQHYLVQDTSQGHNPDQKSTLAHFGTPNSETTIRGHKLYWHQGRNPDIKIDLPEEEVKDKHTQTTLIRPLKPGVTFEHKIRFENLRPHELGALLWALTLPGKTDKTYRHKFGMGKPLGMGAVAIRVKRVVVSQRTPNDSKGTRYQQLFASNRWQSAEIDVAATKYTEGFASYMLVDKDLGPNHKRLADLPRIQQLLEILEWRGDNPGQDWLEWMRYMSIEHETLENEYAERPVLPTPSGVVGRVIGRR